MFILENEECRGVCVVSVLGSDEYFPGCKDEFDQNSCYHLDIDWSEELCSLTAFLGMISMVKMISIMDKKFQISKIEIPKIEISKIFFVVSSNFTPIKKET